MSRLADNQTLTSSGGEGSRRQVLVLGPESAGRAIEAWVHDRVGEGLDLAWTDSVATALQVADRRPLEACLVDLRVGEAAVLRLLRHLRAWASPTPVVVIASRREEEAAARAIQEGACDFLVREELDADRVMRSLRYASELRRLRSTLRAVQTREQEGRARLDAAAAAVGDGLLVLDPDGIVEACSPRAEIILERPAGDLLGLPLSDILRRPLSEDARPLQAEALPPLVTLRTGEPQSAVVGIERNGHRAWLRLSSQPLRAEPPAENCSAIVAISDHSAERQLADQLLQAQKLGVVGRLTGSIAHDLNNLLTAISGYAELLIADLEPEGLRHEAAAEIRHTAGLAATLTSQILSFLRRRRAAPAAIELDGVLGGMQSLLERLLGRDIQLEIAPGAPGAKVWADPSQLEQVILNLAINARDATTDGGWIYLGTTRQPEWAARGRAGEWVVLEVADHGAGMDEATRQRIFEPFFTTKDPDRGTGLGLPIVQTITERAGGGVEVSSEPGRGSRFLVWLPMYVAPPATGPQRMD
ncbi:MAG TPA: ATP-binding protein [Thermoanaerobaculia bacterium]|nr:ATP-binding protein [Thermoanaerobaculia bacterium]